MNNSSDKEKDFLEEEFLKCNIEDLPIPKEDSKFYEKEIQEVMKSGCNRQIAEYVFLEYKKLEDEEKKEEKEKEEKEKKENDKKENDKKAQNEIDLKKLKLYELRNHYDNKYKNSLIEKVVEKINKLINENKEFQDLKDIEGYEDEIDEILEKEDLKAMLKEKNIDNIESYIKHFIYLEIENLNPEDKKKFKETRDLYIEKREAVIEAALRKIKKIVNDENEYKIFYKNYYGKDEPED